MTADTNVFARRLSRPSPFRPWALGRWGVMGLLAACVAVAFSGCYGAVYTRPAPMHQAQPSADWVFYADADVYYSPSYGFYYYYDGRSWIRAQTLPRHFTVRLGPPRRLTYVGPQPYRHYHDHKPQGTARGYFRPR